MRASGREEGAQERRGSSRRERSATLCRHTHMHTAMTTHMHTAMTSCGRAKFRLGRLRWCAGDSRSTRQFAPVSSLSAVRES